MKNINVLKLTFIIFFILISATSGSENKLNSDYTSSALWSQFSLGGLEPDIKVQYHPKGFVKLEANAFYRRNSLLLSVGYVNSGTEAWNINNTWLALGLGMYNKVGEISVNGGVSYAGWSHQIWEGEEIESPKKLGAILKINGLLHLIDGFAGIGLDYTIQRSSEIQYQSLSVFIALGNWNL